MRVLSLIIVLSALAFVAHAQEASMAQPRTAAAETAAASPQPTRETHHRMAWQQRFTEANTAHDGHLTLEEARTGYHTIAKHFKEIDLDQKGFVTEADVQAWHKATRSLRHSAAGKHGEEGKPWSADRRTGAAVSEPSGTKAAESDLVGSAQSLVPTAPAETEIVPVITPAAVPPGR